MPPSKDKKDIEPDYVPVDVRAGRIRELQKRGFSVVLQDAGDYAAMKGGQVLSVRGATEAAAWDMLIAVKYPQ